MKQSRLLCILVTCLFSTALNAATIFTLDITFGERFYYDHNLNRLGDDILFGGLTIKLSDDGQEIEYLDQNVKYINSNGDEVYDWLVETNDCPLEPTLNCKTLTYRAADSDYYYRYIPPPEPWHESIPHWTESVTFDGATFTSNAIFNDGGDTPIYVNLIATVTDYKVIPIPAAVWLFGSGLLGLIGIARRY